MRSIILERPGLADSTHDGKEIVSSKRFAFVLYIVLTVMLFAGLFGGWFVLRGNTEIWPPTGTPPMSLMNMLPECLTILGSVILLLFARKNLRNADFDKFRLFVLFSALLCILFVFAMGMEYWRLLAGGVKFETVFGGMYFVLTGTFLAHFLGGIFALFRFVKKAKLFPATTGIKHGFANALNWHYLMLALWGCIIILVYM